MLRDTIATKSFTVRTLVRCGMFAPTRPDRAAAALKALRAWGPTSAAGYATAAIRYPDDVALIDERGSLTFLEMHERTNALAHAWSDEGIAAGDVVAILARNHRGFVEALVSCSKLGAHVLLVNTGFSPRQVHEVCAREHARALVHDSEFADHSEFAQPSSDAGSEAGERCRRYVAWTDGRDAAAPTSATLEQLIARGDRTDLTPPPAKGRIVILTSGTTGTPRGADRRQPATLDPIAGLLERIPLRARERTLISAPLFHSWGLTNLVIGIGLSSTLVLQRRFRPEETLRAIDAHGVTALVVVPVMLQRILQCGPRVVRMHDAGSLRVIAASGSALPGDLAAQVMNAFGDVLYNLYGSTEVAWATIATPADLRAAPSTAGSPPRGTVVRLFDDAGSELAPGETGRIFVGNALAFDGYTDGAGKPPVDGLVASGDVGRFDDAGRLFVEGREDEMIVSGGENVFPREVEDAIATLAGVREVAAIGVPDADFGQRLRAFVVRDDGAPITAEAVREHVRASLARFKIPRDVVFVGELPRNATGKVLKRALPGAP